MTSRRAILLLVVALAGLAAAAVAVAQSVLPPSVTIDTRFSPPDGIARDDLGGTLTDIPSAVAVDGDRIYTVGEVRDSSSNSDVAIIARRTNGLYDSGFSGDGKLVIPLAADTGKDVGVGIVVLPDGRLRVLASTDATAGSGTNIDNAIVGLNADGSFDTSFGGGDGKVSFPAGQNNDTPTRLAVGPDGRLAVSGARSDGTKEDSFVSLREPDGSPVAGFGTDGVRSLNRGGGTLNDRAVDVVFRPGGGIVALIQNETNPDASINDYQSVLHGFDDQGNDDARFSEDGDLVLPVGDPDTVPGGLMVYEDRLWVTGSTKAGQDTNAYLARVDAAGGGFESRQYDMRGSVIDAQTLVTSAGSDMAVVPGVTPTLVVTGSINYSSRPYWAAASFNKLSGPLAEMGFGDVIIPTDEYGAIVGVAVGGDGWVGIAGSLVDTQQNFDTSFGTSRLLIDADKRCDLSIDVPRPLEIGMVPGGRAQVQVAVTNVATKACEGTVKVPAPYALALPGVPGPVKTGVVAPGQTVTMLADLSYAGPRRREDTVPFEVDGIGDVVVQNDVRRVSVLFDFCDLTLRRVAGGTVLPNEGGARVSVLVRNAGTTSCSKVRLAAGERARTFGGGGAYRLRPGRSADDDIRLGVAPGTRSGQRVGLRVVAAKVANEVDDEIWVTPTIVRVGDSDIRGTGARGVRGSARGGSGRIAKGRLRVRRVEVAVRRLGGRGCRWLASTRATFRKASCSGRVWVRARGTRSWRLSLSRSLPRGRYVVYSRAVIRAGFPEASFSQRDRNRRTFTIR